MKRLLSLILVVVFAVITAGCGDKPGEQTSEQTGREPADTWTDYVSREGGFTVRVPKPPSYQTSEASTAVGSITVHTFVIEHGQMVYAVMYNDIPGNLPDVPEALADGRDGTLATAGEGAELVYEKDISIDGNPGLEFRINVPDPAGVYTARMYVVGDRLYQVLAMSPAGVNADEAVFKFLDSFELR